MTPDGHGLGVPPATPPVGTAGRYVDVRPGAVATFDGDRVRFLLLVVGRDGVTHVDRRGPASLEEALVRPLREGGADTIRFGDRARCEAALGRVGLEAVERRLRAVARDERATLVTWTRAVPRQSGADHPDDRPVGRVG